jgi:predicted NBD/HSP70 family sugar kinase/DNA-binding CsgD family transcriptional regulator
MVDEMAEETVPRRATAPLLKDLNERTVLEAIRSGSPISRAEISRRAGISKPTVSLALQSLLEAGLVREAIHDPDGPSYGATFFEPVAEAALVLGVDVGARFLRGALCDLTGAIRARHDVELPVVDAATVLEAVTGLRDALVLSAGLPADRIDGAVVGVPGVVDAGSGLVRLADNVPGLEGTAFGDELELQLGLPAQVENDINLAALGEQWRGVAGGVDDFAFLSIGTGLGAGVVLRGELHRGRHGAAGELDYVGAGLGLDLDPCAQAVSDFAAAMAAGAQTTLVPPYDVRDVFAAARGGDAVALAVVDEEARRIALHIVPLAAVTDLALVVLGGGLGANGDLLLGPVRERLAEWVPYPPRVEVSSLGEAAVLTGALSVGVGRALDSVFVNRARAARSA